MSSDGLRVLGGRPEELLELYVDGLGIQERSELFSQSADTSTYSMTCYEVLTGKEPFEGAPIEK